MHTFMHTQTCNHNFQSDFANNEKFITLHVSNKFGGRKVYFPGELRKGVVGGGVYWEGWNKT